EKAKQSKELQESIFRIDVEVQLSRIKELIQRSNGKKEDLVGVEQNHAEIKEYIDKTNLELEDNLDEVNAMSRERIEMQTRIHRLDELKNNKENQISLLTDRVNDFEKSVKEAKDRGNNLRNHIERDENDIIYKEKVKEELFDEIEGINHEIKTFETNVLTAEERIVLNEETIQNNEQLIAREEKNQTKYREELRLLTDAIVVELDKKLKESGYSYKERQDIEQEIKNHIKNLIMRLSGKSRITRDFMKTISGNRESVEKYLRELLVSIESTVEEVQILNKFILSYIEMTPSFLDEFLSPEGVITRKRKNDIALNGSLETVKTYNNEIRDLREENRNLNQKLTQYRQTLEKLKISQTDMKGRADSLQSLISNLKRSIQEQELLFEDSRKDIDVSLERIVETKERIKKTEDELHAVLEEEKQLHQDLHAIVKEIEIRNKSVHSRRESVNSRFSQLSSLTNRLERLKAEQITLEHETSFIYENFEDTYSRSLNEFDSKMFEERDDIQQLRQKLKMYKQDMQNLGYINHLAAEEFLEVKERYEFLTRQINDLENAKSDLKQITDEIAAKSEELFAACYAKLKANFHIMFRRLFGGGRAELKLIDPDDMLHTGIDILAQPPGKKLEKISLLSGGERSLTAVALLFATYMVKPSPFCILDEIDAALDDANIDHFLDVLQEFSENSQFIIITHNKKTVLGSKTLLGVTMEEAGVSKAISYRIQDIENEESLTGIG
ncbi:MAG: chromosome segregation protein SMC, partial [Spirochaetales bacterium]|nr:chromosome segregation protein SMC [Spirochaetales bacterium]